MWAHFLAISAAFLAIAVIVALSVYSHTDSAARMYSATQLAHHNGSQPTAFFATDFTAVQPKANSDFLIALGREGARWAHNVHCEANIWNVVILVILVVVLGYGFWAQRLRL